MQRYGIPQSRTKGGSISKLLRLTTNGSRYGPYIARRISKTAPLWQERRLRASKAESWMPSAFTNRPSVRRVGTALSRMRRSPMRSAAQFYAARGFETFADAYLRNARNCYDRWGAHGKVKQLDERHPRLREARSPTPSTTIDPPVGQLDVETVVKASQAISSEMVLPQADRESPPNRRGECRGRAGSADPPSGWRASDRSRGYHWPRRDRGRGSSRQGSRRPIFPNPRCIT